MKSEIIHFFNKKNTHINPGIILGIHEHRDFKHEHTYVICNLNHHEQAIGTTDAYSNLEKNGCNIKHVNSFLSLLPILVRSSETFVLHGSISPFRKSLLFLLIIFLLNRPALKRTTLVAWGAGDFAPEIGILSKPYHAILRRLKHIVTLSIEDFNICTNRGASNALQLNYITKKNISPAPETLNKSNGIKTIMVSHSGWPHNYHLKSFNAIKNNVHGEFRVICPLAYGDSRYIDSVIEAGTNFFGDKFSYFTELLSIESYEKMLKDVDVYITAATIQTGLFAITSCLANGAKIYCDSNLYKSLSSLGFKVSSFKDLENMDKNSFYEITTKDAQENRNIYVKQYHNFESLTTAWNNVYSIE